MTLYGFTCLEQSIFPYRAGAVMYFAGNENEISHLFSVISVPQRKPVLYFSWLAMSMFPLQ